MAVFDTRALRVLATLLVAALCLGFVYFARDTLLIFLLAIFFAYLIAPLVPRLQRLLRISRTRAVAIIYLVLLAAIGISGYLLAPRLVQESEKFADALPTFSQQIKSGQIAQQIGAERGWSMTTRYKLQQFLIQHQNVVDWVKDQIAGYAGVVARHLWWLLLVPLLAIFFLIDAGKIMEALVELLSHRRQQEFLEGLLKDLHNVMAQFIRGQIILAALSVVAFDVFLPILHVPYAFVLGTLAGVLEFIPVVGPLSGALAIASTCLLTGYAHWVLLLLFLGGWRVMQDYYNSPHILGNSVELHPLAVLFGILAGGEIAGVLGVYISIPAMASLRVLWLRWHSYEAARRLTTPPGAPSIISLPGDGEEVEPRDSKAAG